MLAVFLCVVLALVFAACGGDDEPASSSGDTAAATETATEAPTEAATEEADAGEPEGEEEEGEEGKSEEEREREEAEARENAGKACSEVDLDGKPKNEPPSDLTILDGAKVYESEGPFGKTERFMAAVDGEPAEMPEKRDAAAQALEQAGYSIRSTDEEADAEAEAHLEGADGQTVDIQVKPLCEGKLRIRYTVS
jgi:hypothetical protein